MGELAASLAHELKQPIAAAITDAKTCVRWLRRNAPDVAEACDAAARVVSDATRAADIVDRVRSLYRRETPQREMVQLNQIIREMIVLLHDAASRYSISIGADLDPGLPAIIGDQVQLQQLMMNLMLNGIEAMKETRGELTVTSKRTDDGQLIISVKDLGIGLPVGETERIFEAFFTTKPQGTGMGLSISRKIIESHGGRLWATSNAGRGAIFSFTLPTAVETKPSLQARTANLHC
jgi:signal transduction histidine kinase